MTASSKPQAYRSRTRGVEELQTPTATTRREAQKPRFTPEQWHTLRTAVEQLHGDLKLPYKWSIRNDLSIVKALSKRWGFDDLLAMIEGLSVLRARGDVSWIHPREAVTLRALRKMSGVERVEHKALAAGYQARTTQAPPRKPEAKSTAPSSIASIVAQVMPR